MTKNVGPLIEQRALDQGKRGGDDGALAGVVGGDVDKRLVGQKCHRLINSVIRDAARLRHYCCDFGLDAEIDTAQPVEFIFRPNTAITKHERQR